MVAFGSGFRLVSFVLLRFDSARVGWLGVRCPLHATGGGLTLLLFRPKSDMRKWRNTVFHFLHVCPLWYFFSFGCVVSPPDWVRKPDGLEGTHGPWSKYSDRNGPEIHCRCGISGVGRGSVGAVLPLNTTRCCQYSAYAPPSRLVPFDACLSSVAARG